MTDAIKTHEKIRSLARIAQGVALLGQLIIAAVVAYAAYLLMFEGGAVDGQIATAFLDEGKTASFTPGQRLLATTLLLLSDALGFYGLFIAYKLFTGYRHNEIFSALFASRLKRIGWVVVLIPPVSKFSEIVGTFYFTRVLEPQRANIELSIMDNDIYAIVFGLLIVVVGHIMYEAVRISNENKSFV